MLNILSKYLKKRKEYHREIIAKCSISMAFLCLTGLLYGCSAGKGSIAETSISEDGKETLVLWSYYETKEQQDSLDRLIEAFNTSQGRYRMKWEYHGPVIEFDKKLALALTEKEMPDLVIADQSNMQAYISKGLLEDITSYVQYSGKEPEYFESALGAAKSQDRYYGLPFCCNTAALFYNKDYLAKAGIEAPENLHEFVLAAKVLSDGDTYGFGMSAARGSQSASQILPWVISTGDRENVLERDDTLNFFAVIQELVQSGSMPKECINWSGNDVARSFLAGEIAMMENSMDVLPLLEKSSVSTGVVKLPSGEGRKSMAGGENIGILKGKNKTGALAFLDFYLDDPVMEQICGPQFGLAPKKELARKQAEKDSRYKVFEEELENSISRNSYAQWSASSDKLSEALIEIILEKRKIGFR